MVTDATAMATAAVHQEWIFNATFNLPTNDGCFTIFAIPNKVSPWHGGRPVPSSRCETASAISSVSIVCTCNVDVMNECFLGGARFGSSIQILNSAFVFGRAR